MTRRESKRGASFISDPNELLGSSIGLTFGARAAPDVPLGSPLAVEYGKGCLPSLTPWVLGNIRPSELMCTVARESRAVLHPTSLV